MKKILLIIAALCFIPSTALAVRSTQIGDNPVAGYILQASSTGNTAWVATSTLGITGGSGTPVLNTNPFQATYFQATSTTATSTFLASVQIGSTTMNAMLGVTGTSSSTVNPFLVASSSGSKGNLLTILPSGNVIIGTNSALNILNPTNVSFGGTYGTSAPGSTNNLKWDMYNDGGGTRFGIGMSAGLMEYQSANNGGHEFFVSGGTASLMLCGGSTCTAGNIGVGSTTPTARFVIQPGVNNIPFLVSSSTNSINLFSIIQNGNVGIATSSPVNTLSVNGDEYITGIRYDTLHSAGTLGSVLTSTVTGTQWIATSSLGISGGASLSGGSPGNLAFWLSSSTLSYIATTTLTAGSGISIFNNPVTIGTTPGIVVNTGVLSNIASSGIAITSSGGGGTGNVTVRNTGVLSLCGLSGDIATSSLSSGCAITNYLTNSGINTFLNTGTNLQAATFEATSTTGTSTFSGSVQVGSSTAPQAFVIDINGNAGIGTSTPGSLLHVVNSTNSATSSIAIGSGYSTVRGRFCLWNGANYTFEYFASNSITPLYATSTTCQ